MKLEVGRPPLELSDEYGNKYKIKEVLKSGKRINYQGKFVGFDLWVGNTLVRIQK